MSNLRTCSNGLADHLRPETIVSPFVLLILSYLGLVALQLLFALRIPGPLLYEDGLGYLGIARYLAGREPAPVFGPMAFYHAGYPLILSPLWRLFDSPDAVHRAALVLNCLVSPLHLLVLFRIARECLGLGSSAALLAALTTSAYPAYLLQSSFTWTEALFPVAFSFLVLTGFRSVRSGRLTSILLFAVTGAFLYTLHPRGLLLTALVATFLAISFTIRGPIARTGAAVGMFVLVTLFLTTHWLHAHLREELWIYGATVHDAAPLFYLARLLEWYSLLVRAAGHSWYLTTATLGVFPLGLAVLARMALSRSLEPDKRVFAVFTLIAAIAVFVSSLIFLLPAKRADHLVYGRYNEGILAPILLAGLGALITRSSLRFTQIMLLMLVPSSIVALGFVTRYGNPPEVLSTGPMYLTVLGVLVFSRTAGSLDFISASWLAIGPVVALGIFATRVPRLAVLGLAGFFLFSAIEVESRLLRPFIGYWANLLTLQDTVRDFPGLRAISYDRASFSLYGFNGYQFWLPQVRFLTFDSRTDGRPPTDIVIAARDWIGGKEWGATRVVAERHLDQALWLMPGAQCDVDPAALTGRRPGSP